MSHGCAWKLFALVLAACSAPAEPPPPDVPGLDVAVDDAATDAAADAPPDVPACFAHEYPQCGLEIYDLCVPYHGCVFYTCEGQSYGYCGPQG